MYCIIIRFLLSTLISTTFLNSGVENSEWLTVSFVVSMTSDSRTTKFQYFAVFSVFCIYSCLNYSFGMFILIGNIRLEEIKGQVVKLWVTNSGKTLALLITKH